MASTFFGLSISYKGLQAAQTSITTTAHNLSNINTDGYTKQSVLLQASDALRTYSTYGTIGSGVNVVEIKQTRDSYYDEKYRNNCANYGQYEAKNNYMTQVEDYLNEFLLSGFSKEYGNFFDAVNQLTITPADTSAKNQLINNAKSMTDYFNTLANNLRNVQADANNEVKDTVEHINTLAQNITALNKQINQIEACYGDANDLRDQRNALVDELSKAVNITVSETEIQNGLTSFQITINGQSLVNDYSYRTLEVVARGEVRNTSDADGLYDIKWNDGSDFNIYSDSLGGQLKALIDIRDGCNGEIESYAKNDDGTYKTDIDGNIVTETNAQAGENINYKGVPFYQVQLNTFIQTFAQAVNSIFESGYVSDADTTDAKNKGIPLFVVQDGSGVLTATTVSVNSALLEDADKLATKSNVGDGESQCDLIEQINALQKKKIFDGGTGAYFLESIVSDVSIDSSKAKTFLSNYNNMKTTIQNQRLSVMGVDTDEEAMDLMKFQQAYNLNSKMMSVMNEIYDKLISMTLSIYTPSNYILPSRAEKYADLNHEGKNRLTQVGREQGIRRLMSINLLKRLESSVHSFRLTLQRIQDLLRFTLDTIANYDPNRIVELHDLTAADFDADDQEADLFTVGKKVKIELADMDYLTWKRDLEEDLTILQALLDAVADITPDHEAKLQILLETLTQKIENPLNGNNKKVIIFTAFSDTASYLFDHVSKFALEHFGLNTALITGSVDGKTTVPKFKADLNNVLTCFSPLSKDKAALMPDGPNIDLLIATDCISEGQNLQDCDCLVNYDIHWNPVRLVQRFGRIDRIGSRNDRIQLINFWPDMALDDYINLKARVETRMKALVMTSTGDDNLLSPEEQGDLEYRRRQLQRLQTEVVDLEEMGTGVSITDLGLNEFRMELMEYAKHHPELETSPGGISAVAKATPDAPAGVVFVLKNVHNEVNIDSRNRLHPYYLVYLSEDGVTIHDHLSPKDTLDAMRQLCRGKDKPIEGLYQAFNAETDDGRSMEVYSSLLEDAVLSIVDAKEDSDLDSLFKSGGTSALLSQVSGLDDFQLVCFLVVREEER